MASPAQWHASPRRGQRPRVDAGTGEIRVPLALYHFDEHQADVDLVLSRVEGDALLARLSTALTDPADPAMRRGPEIVR